jgi:hypothetical protein
MSKNSFKELEELYTKDRNNAFIETKKKINANINLFGFISNIIDLYVPKVGNVLSSFDNSISKSDKKIKKYPNK